MPDRLEMLDILHRAGRGIGKVDRDGLRGATLVTTDEIEAMAALLAILGIKPVDPGEYTPPSLTPYSEGERR